MNPILVLRALVAKILLRFLFAHDIDNNLIWSNPCLWELERKRDRYIVADSGLPINIFERVRTGDIADRDNPFDLAISIPVIAHLAGVDWSVEECMRHALRYLEMIENVEKQAANCVFAGVKEALAKIAAYPDVCQAALTDCPLWLALLRLFYAGLLPNFGAVIGVQTFVPDYMRTSKYWPVVEACLAWTERIITEKAKDVRILVALDQTACKPSAAGLLKLLETDNFAPATEVVVTMSGDKAKDGRVAVNIRPNVKSAHFVHTTIAECDSLGAADPVPDLVITEDFGEIFTLLDQLRAA
jgi:hypothetical protein